MNTNSLCTVVFSPTGTSRKIAAAIARGLDCAAGSRPQETPTPDAVPAVREIDLTHGDPSGEIVLPADAIAVIAVPVYGGHIAPTAAQRLAKVRGSGTPAVIAVVYGNRAFEHAAAELADLATRQGFIPVAAAAFVGEHSYSTPETPIAAGRPDAEDLAAAEQFGKSVREKLAAGNISAVDATRLKDRPTPLMAMLRFIRFFLRYRRQQKKHPAVYLPEGDAARCTHCGRCTAVCPVGAIARGDETHTDPARCIRCCACVKGCPVGARTFHTPFAEPLSRSFARRKEPVTRL